MCPSVFHKNCLLIVVKKFKFKGKNPFHQDNFTLVPIAGKEPPKKKRKINSIEFVPGYLQLENAGRNCFGNSVVQSILGLQAVGDMLKLQEGNLSQTAAIMLQYFRLQDESKESKVPMQNLNPMFTALGTL